MRILLKPVLTIVSGTLCLLAAACVSQSRPEKSPAPINNPVDAFEAVGQPQDTTGAPQSGSDTLSSDIRRLKNAHSAYQRAQERQAAEVRHSQAKCRARPDSRTVPIQDGSGDPNAAYCQPPPGSDNNGSP